MAANMQDAPAPSTKREKDAGLSHIERVQTEDSDIALEPWMDKHLTRKFDLHILPWLFGLWLLAFIDRSNIGNARIDGLATDLKLNQNKFNIALAIFYVPYICIDVPSNLVLKYFNAGYYLPGLLVSWGLVSMCTGFVKSYHGLLAVRFFLGLCEGGLLGGLIIYLAMFFPRGQLMRRVAYFYCAAPLSGAFGGLLATGLAQINTKGYNGWPFIFFVEGAITVVFGLVAVWFLPHTPAHASFLSTEERHWAAVRMRLDSHGAASANDVAHESFSWHWVRRALLNWNTLLLSLNFFAIITPIYSYSLFLPTIISSLGYSRVTAQLLTVPPNFCAFLTVLLTGYVSDRFNRRGVFMLIGLLVALAGYIMLLAGPNARVAYGGTFLVAAGIFPTSPLVMTWLANNLAPHYVRATGTGFQIMVANLAAFVAVFSYLPSDAPKYRTGHFINVGVICLGLALTSTLMVYQRWENRKRDSGARDGRLAEGDEGRLGYRHPNFRYTL